MTTVEQPNVTTHELVITRLVDASPEALFAGWTQPELLTRWFAPEPWSCSEATIEPVAGGKFSVVMRDPEGNAYPCGGVFLEVVENRKLVWTDAFTKGWIPKPDFFMVGTLTFEPEGAGTRYTERVRHWSDEAKREHEAMGFETGWNQCLDQLLEVVGSR